MAMYSWDHDTYAAGILKLTECMNECSTAIMEHRKMTANGMNEGRQSAEGWR